MQIVTPKLDAFSSAIHKSVIKPEIILFGSRLIGTSRPDSDVDLIVVSESFRNWGIAERERMVKDARADLGWLADVFKFSPEEWAKPGYVQEMVRSQHDDPDEWRRLFEKAGRKVGFADIKAAREGRPLRRRGCGCNE